MTLPNIVFRYGNNRASILKCIMMFLSAAGEGVSEMNYVYAACN